MAFQFKVHIILGVWPMWLTGILLYRKRLIVSVTTATITHISQVIVGLT